MWAVAARAYASGQAQDHLRFEGIVGEQLFAIGHFEPTKLEPGRYHAADEAPASWRGHLRGKPGTCRNHSLKAFVGRRAQVVGRSLPSCSSLGQNLDVERRARVPVPQLLGVNPVEARDLRRFQE